VEIGLHKDFVFSVDSALLGELGEKLVSTVHIAVTELVKNAYDADATLVKISFAPVAGEGPRILIEDDGVGMTLREIRENWMTIGTTNKLTSPVSKVYGRPKTGSKGVGRFSCRRLGLKLRLTTIARASGSSIRSQKTVLEFDWKKFIPGKHVESVKCYGTTSTVLGAKTGTTLEMWGAEADEWKRRGFDFVKRQLAVVASNTGAKRKGFKEDPGFRVTIAADGTETEAVDIREEIIDATWGTLTAYVDASGRAHCKLNAKTLGTKTLISSPKFANVRGAKLLIGILPLQKDESRKPQLLANYAREEIASNWGGIQVRHNGFRMYPYGDAGDDWLRIDADRSRRQGRPGDEELFNFAGALKHVDPTRVLLNLLSMRNHIGAVETDSRIQGLSPKMDREGFVENDSFRSLREFTRFAIDWASIYRDQYIRLRKDKEAEDARLELEPVLRREVPKELVVRQAAAYLKAETKRLVSLLPEAKRKSVEESVSKTLKAIELRDSANQLQLEHLRLLAAASTLTLLFAHETRTVVGSLGSLATRVEHLARASDKDRKGESAEIAGQLRGMKTRLETLIDTTGIVGAFSKQPKLERVHLKGAIDLAARCFGALLTAYDIQIDSSRVPGNLTVGPIVAGELYTVLINVISNSIKSVIAAGRSERAIRIEAERDGAKTKLRVLDNGIGLDNEHFEEVFSPFISDPSGDLYARLERAANAEDATLFGTGSGLGLSISRDILTARNSSIKFVPPPLGWMASLEIELQ
jgi:signal transduction histidine kinase